MSRRIAVVTLLALAACSPKQETPEQMAARMQAESDSVKPALQAALDEFARHIAAGRADSAAMAFTEDGALMEANAPTFSGRAAIQAHIAEATGLGTWQLAFTASRVDAYGPLAVEQGIRVENFRPGPHAPAGMAAMFPDTLKDVRAWKKVNGRWLIFAAIGNSIRALPASAPKKH